MAKRSAKCPQCGSRMELEAQTGELIACPQCQAHLTVNIHKTAERDHTKKSAAPPDPLIGKTLCEFEILALLGRGGMGAVYRAKDAKLDRQVAVKVLAPQYARDPKFVQRFEREARAAAAVNHVNIIQIHSVGEDGGHRYIAMELVEGLTLADVLRADGAMPVKRAMTVMKQLASALAEAHGKGVIHRDVKPSNIILAAGDQVKVTDFGIAKRPEVDVNVTQAGRLMGTVTYLPPETARGKPFDARSDLYSLGITFYEMLSGRPPFKGGTTAELIAHHLETEPPPLSESAPDVPSLLCRLVHRLLSKDPARRHHSASELLVALEGLSGASRIGRRRSAGKVPTAKKSERPKLLIPGVIVAAVLAIGLGFVLIFVLGGDDPGPKDGEPPSVAKPVVVKPPPPPPKKPPAWQADWQAAKAKADGLAKAEKFGAALAVYQALSAEDDDAELGEKIQQSASTVHDQAAAAWRRVRDEAQSLSDQKKFDEATAALRPALEVFGIAEHTQQARTMLAKIAAARTAAKPTSRPVVVKPTPPDPATQPVVVKPTPKTRPAPTTQPKPSPADDLRRKRDAQYAQALGPVEALVAAWSFREAEAALAKLKFEDKDLAQRLAMRRDEVARLAKLKAKIVAQVNKTKPWLRKGQAVVPGSGGKKFKTVGEQIALADEKGVTLREVKAVGEKTHRQTWAELDKRVLPKLLVLAVSADNADDQLAAGLLALVRKDAATAEKHFEKARTLGTKIDRYLGPLAAAALARATALLDAKKYAEADKALVALAKKYAKTPWFASHQAELDAAGTQAKAGITEAEAEQLYAKAAELLEKKAVWDLKPLVEKLKTNYPKTIPVTDTKRNPSFAEMAKAVAGLGKFLTVRQDGKGDFKTIQAAIAAAPPNSLIEIQDSGRYFESFTIPREKHGMTLRGAKSQWPSVARRKGGKVNRSAMVVVNGNGTNLERLIVVDPNPPAAGQTSLIAVAGRSFHLSRSIVYRPDSPVHRAVLGIKGRNTIVDQGVIVGGCHSRVGVEYRNAILLGGACQGNKQGELTFVNVLVGPGGSASSTGTWRVRNATITGMLALQNEPNNLFDSIVHQVKSDGRLGARIEHCNLFGKNPIQGVKLGKGCFRGDPQFRDPKNLDYRLKKTSPCRGMASDGGDVGVRYTPGMIEIIKKALELRKKGIIKF